MYVTGINLNMALKAGEPDGYSSLALTFGQAKKLRSWLCTHKFKAINYKEEPERLILILDKKELDYIDDEVRGTTRTYSTCPVHWSLNRKDFHVLNTILTDEEFININKAIEEFGK